MLISLSSSQANGFLKWSRAHEVASNDDDTPDGGTFAVVRVSDTDEATIVPAGRSYRPWQMPGVGTAF